jgi:transposase
MEEPFYACVQLEDMVPKDHILRKIDRWIDFSFMEEKSRALYSDRGRPSIDPEVLLRMMVAGYLHGITSERRLCEEVHLNLAYRWFCRLTLEDRVPDHSTFSKNRHGRAGWSELIRESFTEVVRQAIELGLVRGKHVSVDATTIEADASLGSLEPMVVELSSAEYLAKLDEESGKSPGAQGVSGSDKGSRLRNETHRSRTDPDARIHRRRWKETKLAYSGNVLMDNGSRVILDVEVTEPSIHEETETAAVMIGRSRFLLGITPETVGGDTAYGSGPAVRALIKAGVAPHVPHSEQGKHNAAGIYGKEAFTYDAERDEFICPGGNRLRRRTEHHHSRQTEYAASVKDCRVCTLKRQCTRGRFRSVQRHWDSEYLELAEALRETTGYRLSQRCRKKIEPLFGESKERMGLRRARRRGRANLREQLLLTAMVQNMKRIVTAMERHRRPVAAAAAVYMSSAFQTISRYITALWCRLLSNIDNTEATNHHLCHILYMS